MGAPTAISLRGQCDYCITVRGAEAGTATTERGHRPGVRSTAAGAPIKNQVRQYSFGLSFIRNRCVTRWGRQPVAGSMRCRCRGWHLDIRIWP